MIAEAEYNPPTPEQLRAKAETYLRECRPKDYKQMKRDGTLAGVLLLRVEAAQRFSANLQAGGVWVGEAWNRAIRQELLDSESD